MCKHFVSSHKISGVFIITLIFPPVFKLLEILNSSFSLKIFLNKQLQISPLKIEFSLNKEFCPKQGLEI